MLSQVIGAKMAERGGGVIFNISSGLARMPGEATEHGGRQGRMGGVGNTVYGLSKAALDRFTAGVAPELREKNIAIISIYPGMTMTERFARMMPGIDPSRLERRRPRRRRWPSCAATRCPIQARSSSPARSSTRITSERFRAAATPRGD